MQFLDLYQFLINYFFNRKNLRKSQFLLKNSKVLSRSFLRIMLRGREVCQKPCSFSYRHDRLRDYQT